MHELMIALSALLIALQFVDMATTQKILKMGGRELNPLIGALIEKVGFAGATIFKLAIAALIIWIAWPDRWIWLVIGCVVYGLVIANNLRVIKKGKVRLLDEAA
jgi:hypothetical protein